MQHDLIHTDTHLDHGLSDAHLRWLLPELMERAPEATSAPLVVTLTLPKTLPSVSCALIGPRTGADPVPDSAVELVARGSREWPSRVVHCEPTRSREVTAVLGPHEGAVILYTVYGGPCAPREPGDPSLDDEARRESEAFWRQHALAVG